MDWNMDLARARHNLKKRELAPNKAAGRRVSGYFRDWLTIGADIPPGDPP